MSVLQILHTATLFMVFMAVFAYAFMVGFVFQTLRDNEQEATRKKH